MRWKLLVITTLAAAAVAAGSCATVVYVVLAYTSVDGYDRLLPLSLLPPILAITYAAIFVYRHTARRRKLQAFLAALFSLLVALAAFFLWFVRVIFHHD